MRLRVAGCLALTLGCGADDHTNPVYVNVAPDLPLVVVAQGAALLSGTYVVWQDQHLDKSRAVEATRGTVNGVTTPWDGEHPCAVTFVADVSDPWVVADVLSNCSD